MRGRNPQEEAAMFRSRTFAALMLAAVAAYGTGAFAENGVTAGRILIGQSASLTGTTAEIGRQMRDGALAYLGTVNRQGGINGRKIELITLDDAGQTKVGEANTKRLIGEDRVFWCSPRSEEHTSELQSHSDLVCRLLLEKKK